MMRRVFAVIFGLSLLFAVTSVTMATTAPAGVLGGTDLMFIPTATTLKANSLAAAVNFEEGKYSFFNFDFGVAKDLELGLAAYSYPDETKLSVRGKFRLIRESGNNPGLAIGIQDLGLDDVSPYIVLSKNINDVDVDGYIGFGGGAYDGVFAGINKNFKLSRKSGPLSGVDLYMEADTHGLNIGTKLAVGEQTKINFGLVDMDNWMMGVTFLF